MTQVRHRRGHAVQKTHQAHNETNRQQDRQQTRPYQRSQRGIVRVALGSMVALGAIRKLLGRACWNCRYEAVGAADAAFAAGLVFFGAALRTAAQRFLVAAMIALRPAALSLRFGFAGSALAFLTASHRFRWAAAMRSRAAALKTLFAG